MQSRVLYQGTQTQFISDVKHDIVCQIMLKNALHCDIIPNESEAKSWRNNAVQLSSLLTDSDSKDCYVTFEYLVPFSQKRVDCIIYGKGEDGSENAVHIELKQWSNETVHSAISEGNFVCDQEEDCVQAYTGKSDRIVAHPSQQVKGYHGYLSNFVEVVFNQELSLTGLAYCYNYRKNHSSNPSALYEKKYENLLREYPTYSKDQKEELASILGQLLKNGEGMSIFNKMVSSPIRPSKRLLEEVSKMIEEGNTTTFSLLEDQIIARNMILARVRHIRSDREGNGKKIIIVNGGPGTGKTVIALHVLAELAKTTSNGRGLNVHYATKSKPLLEAVRSQLRPSSRMLISNVSSFIPASVEQDGVDVLLVDEAHRIQNNANNQYTKPENRTELSQIDTLIRAAKISIFFIDDKQAIRGVEIGSSALIKESAQRWGASVEACTLKSQFRCNGSNNYLDWLEEVLYNKPITTSFSLQDYELQIFDDPKKMYDELVKQDKKRGQTARLMAGFCWPWSKETVRGDLVKDVRIGDFAIPWETHDSIDTRTLKKYYPKWYEWAYKPEGIKQCGCIYTAQGFEFDYAGVIIGKDLRFEEQTRQIITDKNESKDSVLKRLVKEANMTFDDYVRNIYRVLMSRGMKGCYLYIMDEPLRNYIRSLLIQERP